MPGVASFTLDRGNIYVMEEAGLAGWAPGVKIKVFGVAVKDLEATRNYLATKDIATTNHPYPAIWVAPEYTCGPIVSFIQA